MKRTILKRFLPIAFTLIILGILYSRLSVKNLMHILAQAHLGWLLCAILMTFPIIGFTAFRFYILIPKGSRISFFKVIRLVLIASVFNTITPAKLGDLSKAIFLHKENHFPKSLSFALVVFEKASDLISILAWAVIMGLILPTTTLIIPSIQIFLAICLILGLAILFVKSFSTIMVQLAYRMSPDPFKIHIEKLGSTWHTLQGYLNENPVKGISVLLISAFISFMHFFQIWLLILALGHVVSLPLSLSYIPLAVIAGLFPFTFAGGGTRDGALIVLFQGLIGRETAAALGLLCIARYFIPALIGLPFLFTMNSANQDL